MRDVLNADCSAAQDGWNGGAHTQFPAHPVNAFHGRVVVGKQTRETNARLRDRIVIGRCVSGRLMLTPRLSTSALRT